MKNKKSAFTLIEIAATTAIIGVLVVGVMSFSGGIIKSVENFKEKYPGYSDGYSDSLSTSLTRLTLDGSAIENMVISGIDATIESGKIKIGPSGSGDPIFLVFDMPVDLSKDFSIVMWSNGNKHTWFTNDPDTYSTSVNGGTHYFYWKNVEQFRYDILQEGSNAKLNSYTQMGNKYSFVQSALTYDSNSREFKNYRNGSPSGSYTFPAGQEWTGEAYLKMHAISFEDTGGFVYIDSVDIDNTKTLSASEISALYSAGSP